MAQKSKSASKSSLRSAGKPKSKQSKSKSKTPSSKNVSNGWSKDLRNLLKRTLISVTSKPKSALHKAVEEGDTDAQVNFQEQMADMRAAMRIAEMQKQQRQQRSVSPTVGRAQQAAQNPAPAKAMSWWQQNNWFNAAGFERETAAARAIDVQLDLEGFDKNSDDYYDHLNSRLQKVFPELSSGSSPSKPRTKSRPPVAPTTGGSKLQGQ